MIQPGKELVSINSYIKDLNFNIPPIASSLCNKTVTTIKKAVGCGFVDSRGCIWIDCAKVHTILRVNTKSTGNYLLETIDSKYKCNCNNSSYVRWASLISIVTRRKEENPTNKYLPLVCDLLQEIEKCNDVKVLRLESKNLQSKTLKSLKKTRKTSLKIKFDELTGEPLAFKSSEFSHIRSVSIFPELSEILWNGLILNKGTHDIITKKSINDEDELYCLCIDNNWNLYWYKEYKDNLECFYKK